jgi:hypothetical protein
MSENCKLQKQILALNPEEKRRLHLCAGDFVLRKWREYIAATGPISYADSCRVGVRRGAMLIAVVEFVFGDARCWTDQNNI